MHDMPPRSDQPPPGNQPALSNRNETLLRQEFKRRYLTEFAGYVGGLMEESGGHSANFLFMLAVLGIGAAGLPAAIPIAALLGVGISARYAQVEKRVKAAQSRAAEAVAETLLSEDRVLPHVEAWLDRHLEDLPGYLDKLDRYEDERRAVAALVDKANRTGSVDHLTAADRALLQRHGVKRFVPPLRPLYRLPPRQQLGNWHFTELDRALWRDIEHRAGSDGGMLRTMLGIGRRPGP
jgi:hypothetical protein